MLLRISNLVGALALPALVDSASCFLPNGSVNVTDVPCLSESDGTSRCCAPDELCSSNKLCVSKVDHNKFSQGSCLDKAFGSTCPDFCKGINDGGKVTVLPCGSPSLGEFCCDDGKGFQCCATPTSVLIIGVGTAFSEGAIKFTSMSTRPGSSVEATASQTSSDAQTTVQVTSSSPALTTNPVPATTSFSEAPAASSSAESSSSVELSSIQSRSPLESRPFPSSSTQSTETALAAPSQSSVAAPSSSAVQVPSAASSSSPATMETIFAPPAQSSTVLPSTSAVQPSVESQISSATFTQPLLATTLIPLPSTVISSIRSSTFPIVPQSISVSPTPARASSAATSLVASDVDSDPSNPARRTSAAAVAGASVASVLVVTALIIVGFFLYRKRKAKHISENFEASLGRTNIVNEKGSIRRGRVGILGKTRSGGSGDSKGSFNSPIAKSPVASVPAAPENAWRPQRPPRPEMVPSQASSTFRRLLYDVQSNPF
ncbi:hypothetical protein N431DRAFT_72600 [Stipitochalara longipes BDJ]|nr:hypothetical protein N431DRAFT_72600 [Stipitochalara longipes BDJ]